MSFKEIALTLILLELITINGVLVLTREPATMHNSEYVLMLETQLQEAVALMIPVKARIDHIISVGTESYNGLEATKQQLGECQMLLEAGK